MFRRREAPGYIESVDISEQGSQRPVRDTAVREPKPSRAPDATGTIERSDVRVGHESRALAFPVKTAKMGMALSSKGKV
jgi:hypothetical protein